jgi:sulfhydrogenase subunit delta
MAGTKRRPRLAVFKFASCDGCQLSLLDLEEWLLELADAVEIAYFREATSIASEGPFDLTLIDGSITTPSDAERIKSIRARSGRLVALGACATAGGIQALRNFVDVRDLCRIVCLECKLRGNVCVMVTGTPCLGPVTHAGCGALCPTYQRGCYGCFGPMEAPNTGSMAAAFAAAGASREDLLRAFRTFTGNAPAFRAEAAKHAGRGS